MSPRVSGSRCGSVWFGLLVGGTGVLVDGEVFGLLGVWRRGVSAGFVVFGVGYRRRVDWSRRLASFLGADSKWWVFEYRLR